MVIKGQIIKEPVVDGNKIKYSVLTDNQKNDILSNGKQAVKDAIFLRKGQIIEIEGESLEGSILANSAMIDIIMLMK